MTDSLSILADIGGTHARFCRLGQGSDGRAALLDVRKYKAAEYHDLATALAVYAAETGIAPRGDLYIATAAYEDTDGVWKFVNRNKWHISANDLAGHGWNLRKILNDFEAATWALQDLAADKLTLVKAGTSKSDAPLCLMGPGTGLGLGYMVWPQGRAYVQKTHGGHMLASCTTQEQWEILSTVRTLKPDNSPVTFENLASGPGLLMIYQAALVLSGQPAEATRTEHVLEAIDTTEAQDALRLFHEFLGLFAHMAVITAHAYGGVYIIGGVIERLSEHGLFNADLLSRSFVQPGVSSVEEALRSTPVYIVENAYLALDGLKTLIGQDHA